MPETFAGDLERVDQREAEELALASIMLRIYSVDTAGSRQKATARVSL